MATTFRNNVTKNIGTVPNSVYTAGNGIYTTASGMVLANLTESVESKCNFNSNDPVTGFIVKDVLIAPTPVYVC